MKAKHIISLALSAAFAASSTFALAGTGHYGINLGSGPEALAYANGGGGIAMICSASNANGWMARQNSGVGIVKDFTMHLNAHDAPSILGNGGVLQSQFANANSPFSGSVFAVDNSGNFNNINFTGGYIGNVAFPSLNAGNTTGSGVMSLDIQPLTATVNNSGGNPGGSKSDGVGWSISHYVVSVDNCNTSGVTNVSSISVNTNEFINSFFGQTHDPQDLVVTVPVGQITGFVNWINEPNGGAQDLRNGSVEYFDTAGNPIGTLGLHGLVIRGIVKTNIFDQATAPTMSVYMSISSMDWTHA